MVYCSTFDSPQHGRVACPPGDIIYGATCDLSCDDGYHLPEGKSNVTCMENGHGNEKTGNISCQRRLTPHTTQENTFISMHTIFWHFLEIEKLQRSLMLFQTILCNLHLSYFSTKSFFIRFILIFHKYSQSMRYRASGCRTGIRRWLESRVQWGIHS